MEQRLSRRCFFCYSSCWLLIDDDCDGKDDM